MADLSVSPFLMFGGKAEEAMDFCVCRFAGAEVLGNLRYGTSHAGTEGSVMKASFSIGDLTVMCTDSTVKHAFTFTPSVSLFVDCESDEEVIRLSSVLSAGGDILMELGDYGFSRKVTGVNHRSDASWQLNLA